MSEYISKTTAIEELEEEIGTIDKPDARDALINMGLKIALRDIKRLPSADVQPVKRGRWIAENRDSRGYADCYTCTNCNCYSYTYTLMKDCEYEYCPNCGARMDGDSE